MPDKNEDEIRRLLQQQVTDQGEAGAANLGRLAGSLYTSMLAHGLPVRLAGTLTRDWFYLNMHKAMFPNTPPQAPFWDSQYGEEDE
jgi:hypothetical protein